MECVGSCLECDPDNVASCQSCDTGYYLSTIYGVDKCSPCMDNCKECTLGNTCDVCKRGYFFDDSLGQCVRNCEYPCSSCVSASLAEESGQECLGCFAGYSLNGYECVADISCTETASCTACPNGYVLDAENSICIRCETDSSNCAKCKSVDELDVCRKCVSGYSLNTATGECVRCESQCKKCMQNEPGQCISCADGFFMVLDSLEEETGVCSACS